MRITKKLFLFAILIFSFSCEEEVILVNCQDCISEEPSDTSLEIKLDASSTGYDTFIKIYEGNLEDSILYSSQQGNTFYSLKVPVAINKKYTVTATYHIHDNYYTAVDAATPRVKYDKNQCKDPCYFVYDKDIDLRLKYTK
ncbi:MAG TPA: hypothetical protein VF346_02465 [Bacteroidales bacterium]